MNILGISVFYHDSAVTLVMDGEIHAAAQEERFTIIKHDHAFPANSVEYCLKAQELTIDEIDIVAFYDNPFPKFERLLETYLSYAPFGIKSFIKAMAVWIKQKLWMKEVIKNEQGFTGKVLFPSHHQSHAASAFYTYAISEGMEGARRYYGFYNDEGAPHPPVFPGNNASWRRFSPCG